MLTNILPAKCQQQIPIGNHSIGHLLYRTLLNKLRIRSRFRSSLKLHRTPKTRLGKASQFSPGDWVRVLDQDRIKATLNEHDRFRGLWFAEQQWPYCEKIFQVTKVVRRILDDNGVMRPVSRTVLLGQTGCGGVDGNAGCGRDCPLMFRDEWLEPVLQRPALLSSSESERQLVTIRRFPEIKLTLNRLGRHEGILYMPEMSMYSEKKFHVFRQITDVFELNKSLKPKARVYMLDDLTCSGDVLKGDGPCHRGCRLLWHHDWLCFHS